MNTEDQIDNTIASLKIISMVQKNGRLSVHKGQLTLDKDDHFQKIRRWFNKDSRELMIMHVKNTITSAISLSKGIIDNKIDADLKNWSIAQLAKEMQNCQVGLTNLKTTYNDDSIIVCTLDVISERLQEHCKNLLQFEELKLIKQ
jgi:hypothetical protein